MAKSNGKRSGRGRLSWDGRLGRRVRNAVLAGAMQGDQVGLLADVELGLLAPQTTLGLGHSHALLPGDLHAASSLGHRPGGRERATGSPPTITLPTAGTHRVHPYLHHIARKS